jgi:hypothetical protein
MPNGRRRRLQGPWRTRAARPGIRFRVDAPRARERSARTPPLLWRRLPLRCLNRRAPPSPSVRSSSAQPSGVPAGRARGVSPRAVTHRSAPVPRTPAPRYPGAWVSLSLAVMASALAVTTTRASSSAGSAGKPGHGRDLAARCPDGGRAMMVRWRLDQGQDQSGCVLPLAGPAVTSTGPSPHYLSSTPAPIPRWPG